MVTLSLTQRHDIEAKALPEDLLPQKLSSTVLLRDWTVALIIWGNNYSRKVQEQNIMGITSSIFCT